MKYIPLFEGKHAIVDEEDYKSIIQLPYVWKIYKQGYVGTCVKNVILYLHRMVLDMIPCQKLFVHFINENKLDCRKKNLLICTPSQLQMRGKTRNIEGKSSRYKGVCWCKKREQWLSYIYLSGKKYHLGRYLTEEHAAAAYNEAALKFFGNYARLNEIVVDTDKGVTENDYPC